MEHELDRALARINALQGELEQTKMFLGAERSHVRSLQSRLDTVNAEMICRAALYRVVAWIQRPYHEVGGTMMPATYEAITAALTAVIGDDVISALTADAA